MRNTEPFSISPGLPPKSPSSIRAMTLNIVHGTRVCLPTPLFRSAFVERRLFRIGDMVRQARVDVLALQEADGDRRFERTREIAIHAELPTVLEAVGRERHGATLASRLPLRPLRVDRFALRRRDAKGFVLARVRLPSGEDVDIASIHLAAFSRRVRSRQIDAFVRAVAEEHERRGPRALVVLGDLNDSYEGSVRELAEQLDLRTVDRSTPTYTDLGLALRLDWVLASSELEVTLHRVQASGLSDHRPVVADIRMRASNIPSTSETA